MSAKEELLAELGRVMGVIGLGEEQELGIHEKGKLVDDMDVVDIQDSVAELVYKGEGLVSLPSQQTEQTHVGLSAPHQTQQSGFELPAPQPASPIPNFREYTHTPTPGLGERGPSPPHPAAARPPAKNKSLPGAAAENSQRAKRRKGPLQIKRLTPVPTHEPAEPFSIEAFTAAAFAPSRMTPQAIPDSLFSASVPPETATEPSAPPAPAPTAAIMARVTSAPAPPATSTRWMPSPPPLEAVKARAAARAAKPAEKQRLEALEPITAPPSPPPPARGTRIGPFEFDPSFGFVFNNDPNRDRIVQATHFKLRGKDWGKEWAKNQPESEITKAVTFTKPGPLVKRLTEKGKEDEEMGDAKEGDDGEMRFSGTKGTWRRTMFGGRCYVPAKEED